MSVDKSPSARPAEADDTARAARRLVRTALKGSLATLDRETGHPYASLILVATEPNGAPIFLISRLALHTRNLEKDPRASVLIDGTGGLGDPLTGGRLTLSGLARPSASSTGLRRFLARHPSAEGYASFADFSIYDLEVAGGHYIGGFGRIVDLSPTALLTSTDDAGAVIDAEPDIVAHMNAIMPTRSRSMQPMLAGAVPRLATGACPASIPTARTCCIAQVRRASTFRVACAHQAKRGQCSSRWCNRRDPGRRPPGNFGNNNLLSEGRPCWRVGRPTLYPTRLVAG